MTTYKQTLFRDATQIGTAAARSATILCENKKAVRLQFSAANTGGPIGTIQVFGTDDDRAATDAGGPTAASGPQPAADTATWTPMTLPAGSVHGTGFTGTLPDVAPAYDGTAAGLNIEIILLDPPKYIYLNLARSAGTSNTTLAGRAVVQTAT